MPVSSLPERERSGIREQTRFLGAERSGERSELFETERLVTIAVRSLIFVGLYEDAAAITKPSEQDQGLVRTRLNDGMRTIDERRGRWVSRDAERSAARRQKERLGVGSRRLEPARILAQLGAPVEVGAGEKIGGGAF